MVKFVSQYFITSHNIFQDTIITSLQIRIIFKGKLPLFYKIQFELMQNDFEKHSSTNECHYEGEHKKKYVKLTPQIKELFLSKIIFENLTIKQASEMLKINYSSAKTIASAHKKQKIGKTRRGINRRAAKVCAFRLIKKEQQVTGVKEILCSLGGRMVSTNIMPKRKLISKVVSTDFEPMSRKMSVQV